jgi:hypothetical protein
MKVATGVGSGLGTGVATGGEGVERGSVVMVDAGAFVGALVGDEVTVGRRVEAGAAVAV